MVCVAIGKTGYEPEPRTNELEQDKGSRFIDAYLVVEREKKYIVRMFVYFMVVSMVRTKAGRYIYIDMYVSWFSNFFLIIFDWVIFHQTEKINAILLTYLVIFAVVGYMLYVLLANSLSISFGHLDVNNELSILT